MIRGKHITEMQAKSAKDRKVAERKRKRAAGLVPMEVWILADKKGELKREIARLNGAKQ